MTIRKHYPELIPGTVVRIFLLCVVLPLIVFGGIVPAFGDGMHDETFTAVKK